jgi:site-specific recombinase XerD
MRRAPLTIARYREALRWVIRDIGDQPVAILNLGHVLSLRRNMEQRGCGEARVAGVLNALRSFLKFCRETLRLPTLDPRQVRVPRIPRREVVYLRPEEVEQFVSAIIRPGERLETVSIARLRFRALVEVLLGTGARISEVLALDRSDLDVERKQAKIVGKGNKQRGRGSTAIWLAGGMINRRSS